MVGHLPGGGRDRFLEPAVSGRDANPWRAIIRRFDGFLSDREGLFCFNADPENILRLQVRKAPHGMDLNGERIRTGQPVLAIHLWSAHLPPLAPPGADGAPPGATGGAYVVWAVQTQRRFVRSLRMVAETMQRDPDLAPLRAIYAATSLFTPVTGASGVHPMARLGFTVIPYASPLGAFGNFWENAYALALMWAYNPASAHSRQLLKIQRTEMWAATRDFLARYGAR